MYDLLSRRLGDLLNKYKIVKQFELENSLKEGFSLNESIRNGYFDIVNNTHVSSLLFDEPTGDIENSLRSRFNLLWSYEILFERQSLLWSVYFEYEKYTKCQCKSGIFCVGRALVSYGFEHKIDKEYVYHCIHNDPGYNLPPLDSNPGIIQSQLSSICEFYEQFIRIKIGLARHYVSDALHRTFANLMFLYGIFKINFRYVKRAFIRKYKISLLQALCYNDSMDEIKQVLEILGLSGMTAGEIRETDCAIVTWHYRRKFRKMTIFHNDDIWLILRACNANFRIKLYNFMKFPPYNALHEILLSRAIENVSNYNLSMGLRREIYYNRPDQRAYLLFSPIELCELEKKPILSRLGQFTDCTFIFQYQ